ncbi:MAG: sigma-54-dependent Fis family transcriptional regulator [Acidobacteria bacterium]|nr:sigma-54-dependent Fis family transcriptional regulator [Acidobacteriota bacterium]
MKRPNILLIDDDRNFLRVLTYHIQEFGFQPLPVSSGSEALQRLAEEKVDLVITDLKMAEMDGLEVLDEIHKRRGELPVVVLTAHGSIDKAVEAIKRGAVDFLTKPFEKEEMRQAIANALKLAHLIEENRNLAQVVRRQFEFEGILGSSKEFREVLEAAEQLAEVDTTVLIQGESGTGKELLARAIHFNSRRRGKPFVVVNCGAIPTDLMESELFGFRKGAFTGAAADKKGKFEVADAGTLLLDEVGELPAHMQVKLLRVLQEQELDVVGDPKPRPVDVRILAASNKDLFVLMQQGAFREDLYYRLSVAPLWLPPLRKRCEDLPLLLAHFLEKFNRKFGREVTFEPAAIEALQQYDWPGNVRELENIVQRSVVFDKDGIVRKDDLPPHFQRPTRAVGKVVLQLPEDGICMEDLERDLLRMALERHHWNQTHAAHYLGISRNTLIYRMQKYEIRPGDKRNGIPGGAS